MNDDIYDLRELNNRDNPLNRTILKEDSDPMNRMVDDVLSVEFLRKKKKIRKRYSSAGRKNYCY